MAVITTLSFAGRTEEALDYYHHALGAEILFLMRFRDSPDQSLTQPGMEDLISHATFRIDGTQIMATDIGQAETAAVFAGFAFVLQMDSTQRAKRAFDALAEGGRILLPLEKSAFTSWYGVVVDRFGVSWKINVDQDSG